MGQKKAKQEPAQIYQQQMQTAATAAEAVSPQEKEYNEYTQKLWDMYTSKTKFDLSKMPNANALMPMYEQAKARSDRGRIGKGLSYGGGPGAEGYNANLIAGIDEQNQSERERDAAGMIEERVADSFSGMPGRMLGIGQSDQNRRNANWGRYSNMYGTEAQIAAQKAAKPKWWESLISGGLGAVGQWAGAGFAT